MRHRAVVFDMFGTLADEPTARSKAAHDAIARLADADPVHLDQFWRDTADARLTGTIGSVTDYLLRMFEALGIIHDNALVDEAVRIRLAFARGALVPRAGAVKTLAALRAQGMKAGLLSNCTAEVVAVWEDSPFPPLLDASVLSAAVGVKKPDPAIYHLACERLGVAPDECLYVGDGGDWELGGAAKVGMEPVLLRVAHERPEDVSYKQEALAWTGTTVSSLPEVLGLLR